MKKPTIHDIAKKLNLNASTISRALNNDSRISSKTKNNVNIVAKAIILPTSWHSSCFKKWKNKPGRGHHTNGR